MPCFHPQKAWLSTNTDGKRKLFFHPNSSNDEILWIPCGQCIFCRIHKSVEWTIRCKHESSLHVQNCFVTLTFNDEHVAKTPEGLLTLPPYQAFFQKFLKRLRKSYGKVRYYAVGEYGSRTFRPHYHAIIFGWFPSDAQIHHFEEGHPVYISDQLQRLWSDPETKKPYGFVTVGQVTDASIAYVAKYCMKKITGKKADDWYKGRLPESTHMSLKPGIGSGWLDVFKDDVYKVDLIADRVYRDSVRYASCDCRPPKYYDTILSRSFPDIWSLIQGERKSYAASRPDPDLVNLRLAEEAWLYRARQNLIARSFAKRDAVLRGAATPFI